MRSFSNIYSEITSNWVTSEPIQNLKKTVGCLSGQPLLFYGAGRLAGVYLDACRELNIQVSGICDKYANGNFRGFEIISPTELSNDFSKAVILVCSHVFNAEISNDLRSLGFSEHQIIPCLSRYPYFESPDSFRHHLEGYQWAYGFFKDKLSKKLILDRISLCLLDKGLVPNTNSECYYADEMVFGKHEVFVDGGAFVGDSAERFIERQEREYEYVYSFEPDNNNYHITAERLKGYPNVEVVKKGLWSMEKTLTFCHDEANPGGSRIEVSHDENDSHSIDVISIDEFFSRRKGAALPTFIKMDIEGSEKEALLGAAKTILKNKPKLAICAYHKAEDIYELPMTIMGIRDDYNFVLRQHEYGGYDTVLYAI